MNVNTEYLADQIYFCDDAKEFEQLVSDNREIYSDWRGKIVPMLRDRGIKFKDLSEYCGIKKNTVTNYTSRIPRHREVVIWMAMIMGLSVPQTDELLTRWAKYHRLYSKSPEDTIWIYLLARGGSRKPVVLFERYWNAYLDICREVGEDGIIPKPDQARADTQILHRDILELAEQDPDAASADGDFRQFMLERLPIFAMGNTALLDYVESLFVQTLECQSGRMLPSELENCRSNRKLTANYLFREDPTFLNKYYKRRHKMKKYHKLPSRLFLIALGLRLALPMEEINKLLALAGMSPLYAKDRLEGTVIFYLNKLMLYHPALFFYPDPEERAANAALHNHDLSTPSPAWILYDPIKKVPTERVHDYIKRMVSRTTFLDDEQLGENSEEKAWKQEFLSYL